MKNIEEQIAVSNKLISEDNRRLKNALENGNMTEARIAQNLITANITANEELKVEKKNEAHSLSSSIKNRKNNLIANFLSKKPKKRLIL